MSHIDQCISGVRAGRDFAAALNANPHEQNIRSPHELLRYYMFAARKQEGFDAICEIREGDKWDDTSHWIGLKGTPQEIAAYYHNNALQNTTGNNEFHDYHDVHCLIDLNHPVTPDMKHTLYSSISPTYAPLIQDLHKTHGDRQADTGNLQQVRFGRHEMYSQIFTGVDALDKRSP